jgi:hypothetical protein
MSSLRDQVADYYFAHAAELPADKQFHLANRLAAWTGDPRARAMLQQFAEEFAPTPTNDENLAAAFRLILTGEPPITMAAYELRRPYFAAYPQLFGAHNALLRLRHLRDIYGIDARAAFASVISTESLHQLEQKLLADPEAIRILSTQVINTLYLFHIVVLENNELPVQAFYDAGQNGYDLHEPEHARLLIYLYTHCILAASNFYIQELPAEHLPIYRAMLQHLEEIIAGQFDQVSLDTKVEFWACCRVAGYDTSLAARIDEECAASVSPDGTFIVDTHNIFRDLQAKNTFDLSEHRNTLFVMSGSAYQPHSTLLSEF